MEFDYHKKDREPFGNVALKTQQDCDFDWIFDQQEWVGVIYGFLQKRRMNINGIFKYFAPTKGDLEGSSDNKT